MNDQLKQRLVGAIVLVSLAVIFLPMIFKGDGGKLDKITTPPEPDYRFPPPKKTPAPPPIASAPVVPVGDAAKETVTEKSIGSDKVGSDKKAEETSKAAATEKKAIEPVVIAEKEENTTTEIKAGQVSAWIVQVGSFSSEPNALALRDRLRKMGFAAFVEAIKGKNGMVYRVRVGPELTRELADKLKSDVEKKSNLKGLVQSYP